MKWKKLGRIFCPDKQYDWMLSHAAVPTAVHLRDNLFRVFFGTRDAANRSHTAFLDIDITQPHRVLSLSREPVLAPGALGTFDDSGALPSWICRSENNFYLYYTGWNLGITVPFRNAIGLAIGSGECFIRASEGPAMDRSFDQPHFVAAPCVLREDDVWRMWYVACVKWAIVNGSPKHWYHICHTQSSDGIRWRQPGQVSIEFSNDTEYAISRPCVLRDRDLYRMWYSFRGSRYRIGYAESQDGVRWHRLDHFSGIDTSGIGWDSEMVAYAFVFDHAGDRYMLYNGNSYGRTGFGIAVLEHD
jgi:hypothetical protein